MSRELADQFGLEIGQKVLYPHNTSYTVNLRIVTVKDVRILPHNNELVVDVEEFDGYLNCNCIYTREQINAMFDYYENDKSIEDFDMDDKSIEKLESLKTKFEKRKLRGTDAINAVYRAVSKTLNSTSAGKELLMNNAHVEQELAARVCKELGLICGHVDERRSEDDWMIFCTKVPRADGLCVKHYDERRRKKHRVGIPCNINK